MTEARAADAVGRMQLPTATGRDACCSLLYFPAGRRTHAAIGGKRPAKDLASMCGCMAGCGWIWVAEWMSGRWATSE